MKSRNAAAPALGEAPTTSGPVPVVSARPALLKRDAPRDERGAEMKETEMREDTTVQPEAEMVKPEVTTSPVFRVIVLAVAVGAFVGVLTEPYTGAGAKIGTQAFTLIVSCGAAVWACRALIRDWQ